MIEQMSPITRRIVAVGLVILVVLLAGQFLLLPIGEAIADQHDDLSALRSRRARLVATARRLMPDSSTMPPGLAVAATDPASAGKRLQALLSGSAATAGVTLTQGVALPVAGSSRILGINLVATGTEAGLSSFASLVEHGSPVIRFQHWRMTMSDAPTTMHFEGFAVAAWQPKA